MSEAKHALLISCFDWYKTRLKPIREILLKQGYTVIVLIADFNHIKKVKIQKKFVECTYIPVRKYKSNISLDRIISHFQFANQVGHYLKILRPELVFCQIPPNNVGKKCANYKKKYPDTRLILDIIDLWPESMPLHRIKRTPPMQVWASWRTEAIKVADHVFTECELYREKLKDALDPEKTSTLYLYKEQSDEERTEIRKAINLRSFTENKIKFAYVGSMNSILDIEGICDVIKSFITKGYKIELHAIGVGEKKDEFERRVKDIGASANFYGGIFDENKKISILAPCHYSFNMMKDGIEVGLTIKSIDYFSYGLPIVNNIKGDTWALVEKKFCGVNVGNDLQVEQLCLPYIQGDEILKLFEGYFSKNAYVNAIEEVMNGCM